MWSDSIEIFDPYKVVIESIAKKNYWKQINKTVRKQNSFLRRILRHINP